MLDRQKCRPIDGTDYRIGGCATGRSDERAKLGVLADTYYVRSGFSPAANFKKGVHTMNNEYTTPEVLEIGKAQDVILGSKTELPPDSDGQFVIGAETDFDE
jgi:hypothetical protein